MDASYDVPGTRLLELVAVMDRLRRECPWDREQTHRSLARYLLEETYETLEAIDSGDSVHLREELGDLLLQVVFHARLAQEDDAESDGFDIDDVAGGIVDKLVHRHPHVFGGLDVSGADEVAANWEALKAAEKGRASVLDGVPMALPALALADKVLGRASRAGVVAPPVVEVRAESDPVVEVRAEPDPVVEVRAESDPVVEVRAESDPVVEVRAESDPVVEVRAERASKPPPPPPLGDRLLALVAQAREAGLDAEQELRDAVRRLADAVRAEEADR
ncbi:MAG TPA: MazG family protein [Nocardioidaceae bacterium]|nr:MazG family protein [Nocardioidaceae bacterium]